MTKGLAVLLSAFVSLGVVVCGNASRPGFDGDRAFSDLVEQVRIGPRPAGSPGAAKTRSLIRDRLRQAGWRVESQALRVAVPGKPGEPALELENVIGVQPGESDQLLLIGAHYDTKPIVGMNFVGANDGASGVAVLLELARVLGDTPRRYTTWLVFFDGEEAIGRSITPNDGLFGSRALAARMQADGSLARIAAFLLVDMVGDRDLNLADDLNSSSELRAVLSDAAESRGMAHLLDPRARVALVDDHTPFLERGVSRALAIIDFQFGARRMPGPFWHTEKDDLSAVSAESLNSVGTLLVEIVERLEKGAPAP